MKCSTISNRWNAEARRNLVEEAADVYNVLGLLLDAEDNAEIYSIIRRKKERWLKRLEG